MRSRSLVDQALEVNTGKNMRGPRTDRGEVELAIAWVHGRVQSVQIAKVLGITSGNVRAWVAVTLAKGALQGMVDLCLLEEDGSPELQEVR